MSSTQHQLIEQCATRLRGIVEALDNIHDTSPQRWSTDLDDVHSSAESLLALIKDQAPARSEASFEEWLANELEGEDGQPVPAAVCDIALARRAFNHWPKLEQPAKVGGVRFSAGVSSRLVVEAAQRLYEFESTPEQEAERIERLQAFREQLDPLNLAPHAEAFNEAPAEALKPEQAEAERPEVVAYRTVGRHAKHQHPHFALNYYKQNAEDQAAHWRERGCEVSEDELMTVAQHERITAQLHDALDESDGDRWKLRSERDAALAEVKRLIGVCASLDSEKREIEHKRDSIIAMRDAALARVAELEKQEPVALANRGIHAFWVKWTEAAAGLYGPCIKLYAHPVAQAQHSVPDVLFDGAAVYAALDDRQRMFTSPENVSVVLDAVVRVVRAAAPTPSNSVPQAWLDVQAERRRQITAEGWTPEHDDAHSHGEMARAAACYALAGSSAPNDGTAALLVSLAWPWDEQWWKPTSTRRDLVKACALALAEIERLDRAGISQNPQPGATTASS